MDACGYEATSINMIATTDNLIFMVTFLAFYDLGLSMKFILAAIVFLTFLL